MAQQANTGDIVEKTRRFSPALFGIIAICFFLPFVALTCSGQELFSIKGIDLVTGTEITEDDISGDIQNQLQQFEEGFGGETTTTETTDEGDKLDPEPAAIVALAVAILGLIAGFALRNETGSLVAAIAGIIGVIALIALRMMFEVPTETTGDAEQLDIQIGYEWRIGWWIALVLFLIQPLIHFAALRRVTGRGAERSQPTTPPPPATSGGTSGTGGTGTT